MLSLPLAHRLHGAGAASAYWFPLQLSPWTLAAERRTLSMAGLAACHQVGALPSWLSGTPHHGLPEVVVEDSLARLAQIVSLSKMGSSQATRDIEFQNEITTYWSFQHGQSFQNPLTVGSTSDCLAVVCAQRSAPGCAIRSGNGLVSIECSSTQRALPAGCRALRCHSRGRNSRFLRQALRLIRISAPRIQKIYCCG